jgi:hypothetical protein
MDKYKIEIEWVKLTSILLNVVLIFVLFKGCDINRCPEFVRTEVRIDTLYRDTSLHLIAETRPQPKKRVAGRVVSDTLIISSRDTAPCDSVMVITNTAVADTTEYVDTLRESGKFKAVLVELVAGEIISRKVYWGNLVPEVTKTVTNTRQQLPRPVALYAGAQLGYSLRNNRLVAAPSAMLAFQRLGFNAAYSYDIVSNAHLVGAWVKIRLKK